MTIWRMAFRVGSRGQELWPICFKLSVAAITYNPLAEIDLSKYPPGEPKKLWAQLEPTQKASLRRVAYEMKKKDVIFVKRGPKIVGRGVVQRRYKFDYEHRIIDQNGTPWPHQLKVKWDLNFPEINIVLGSEQLTVKKLSSEDLKSIDRSAKIANNYYDKIEAEEGDTYKTEAFFRKRNRTLIQIKKLQSNYSCEVCGFNYENHYGKIGHNFIVAHHVKPVSSGPTKTTLDDIALVCANCHAIIHLKKPPVPISRMRELIPQKS